MINGGDAKQIFLFEETCPDCGGKNEIGVIRNSLWDQYLWGQPRLEVVRCRTCNAEGKAVIYRDAEGNRIYYR